MAEERLEAPIGVVFVRASRDGGPDGRLQEWRSRSTGRIFEVRSENSFKMQEGLREGDGGYLDFVDGVPFVRRTADGRSLRAGRRSRPVSRPENRAGAEPKGGRIWLLIFITALLAVVLWKW